MQQIKKTKYIFWELKDRIKIRIPIIVIRGVFQNWTFIMKTLYFKV